MSTITYLDSHCHLFDEAFESDLDAVLSRAAEAGVTLLNIMCTSWQEADRAMAYAVATSGAGDRRLTLNDSPDMEKSILLLFVERMELLQIRVDVGQFVHTA